MSPRRGVLMVIIMGDFGNECTLALYRLELQFQQAQRVQDERILLPAQGAPQMIHLFHRGGIKIENELEGFQLIELITWRIGRDGSWRHAILSKYILELKETDRPG